MSRAPLVEDDQLLTAGGVVEASLEGGKKPRSARFGSELLTATAVLPSLHWATSELFGVSSVVVGRNPPAVPLPAVNVLTPCIIGCDGWTIVPSDAAPVMFPPPSGMTW